IDPDVREIHFVRATVVEQRLRCPVNRELAPAEPVLATGWRAGLGILFVCDGNDHRVQLLQRVRANELRPALALAGVPARPASEIQDRHVSDSRWTNDERVITIRTSQESLGLPFNYLVAERRVDLAQCGLAAQPRSFQAQGREDTLRDQ